MLKRVDSQSITEISDADVETAAELAARFQGEVLPLLDVLRRGARRMTGSQCDAEDLLQDTLLSAYAGFRNFTPDTNFQAWMFRILSNQRISSYRKKQRRPEEYLAGEFTDQQLAASVHARSAFRSAELEVLEALPDSEVKAAVAKLPRALQMVVYYADVEGLSYREIATIMDIPAGTVMSRLHRGRNRLRTLLGDVVRDRGCYRHKEAM